MVYILRLSLSTLNVSSITLDTNYRDWQNVFPGVSVCFDKGLRAPKTYLQAITKGDIKNAMANNFKSLAFLNRVSPLEGVKIEDFKKFQQQYNVNITALRNSFLPQNCREFMLNVRFLGQELDCSGAFIKFETEVGTCFIANQLTWNLEDFVGLPLNYSNKVPAERVLSFDLANSDFLKYKYYIHSPEERPSENMESNLLQMKGVKKFIGLKTAEIHNDENVKHVTIEQRNCRFPFEKFVDFDLPYSMANCISLKKIKLELQECNCTLPIGDLQMLTRMSIPMCDVDMFHCISDTTKKMKENFKERIADCLIPSCISMEITKIADIDETTDDVNGGLIIKVMTKPTLRYVRRVIFTKLDMIGELCFNLFTGGCELN